MGTPQGTQQGMQCLRQQARQCEKDSAPVTPERQPYLWNVGPKEPGQRCWERCFLQVSLGAEVPRAVLEEGEWQASCAAPGVDAKRNGCR